MKKKILLVGLCVSLIMSSFSSCLDDEFWDEEYIDESVESSEMQDGDGTSVITNFERTEPKEAVVVEKIENLTAEIDGVGTGFEIPKSVGQLDENPDRAITRNVTSIPQIRGTDIYGNTLGDEFYYHRSNLTSAEKKAYDQIYLSLINCENTIDISVMITPERFEDVYFGVFYDHPEIFWAESSYNYSYNNQGVVTSVTHTYNDLANNLRQNYEDMQRVALGIAISASQYETEVEQVKYVNDYLSALTVYELNCPYNQSLYSLLNTGRTVCAGYSKAFEYCMQLLGIPSAFVFGYASGGNHAWNIVELDGEHYNVDVTWNDADFGFNYNYFNITDSQISADHQRTEQGLYLPAANGTKYSLANTFGTNATSYDFSNALSYTGSIEFIGDIVNGNATQQVEPVEDYTTAETQGYEDYDETDYDEYAEDDEDYNDYDDDTSGDYSYIYDGVFEICDDDFDWDSYYDCLDQFSEDSSDADLDCDDTGCDSEVFAGGFYDDANGIYYYYDDVNLVYYYYSDDYAAYIGFDAVDWETWYIWDGECWYYL